MLVVNICKKMKISQVIAAIIKSVRKYIKKGEILFTLFMNYFFTMRFVITPFSVETRRK